MFSLENLKVLILEDNDLVKLTTNSLDINSPEISYNVVKKNENGSIATALNNTDKITLVVQSGIVLNLKSEDLPNKSLIEKYHIGASRYGVFTDHPRLKMHYRWVAEDIHPNVLDLSIFVINPEKWDEVPETDEETLKDKKILYMPRYMNHKDDILFKKDATAAVDAFNYGVLGEQAVAHNYVETIQKESINILEIYGYCFDKLQPYLKDVPKKSKDRIQYLVDQTTIKIKNTREKCMEITFEIIEASAIDEDIFEECLINSMEAIKWVFWVHHREFLPITNDSSLSEKKTAILNLYKNVEGCADDNSGYSAADDLGPTEYDVSPPLIIFVCKIDGYIVEYHNGWLADASTNGLLKPIEAGIFHQHAASISRPDQNGSSSWNTGADYALSFLNFCKTQSTGESLKTDMWLPPNSQKWELFKNHQEAGHLTYTIDEELTLPNNYPMNRLLINL